MVKAKIPMYILVANFPSLERTSVQTQEFGTAGSLRFACTKKYDIGSIDYGHKSRFPPTQFLHQLFPCPRLFTTHWNMLVD